MPPSWADTVATTKLSVIEMARIIPGWSSLPPAIARLANFVEGIIEASLVWFFCCEFLVWTIDVICIPPFRLGGTDSIT